MALPETRIHRGRPTPFPGEREALDLVYKHPSLSDTDPQQAWELHELYMTRPRTVSRRSIFSFSHGRDCFLSRSRATPA
jgi:hypothetical protein